MRCRQIIGTVAMMGLLLMVGCATGVVGGKPQLPLSDKRGSARVFVATPNRVIAAITNALGRYEYRGMVLRVNDGAPAPQRIKIEHGFALWAKHEPIAKVPLDQAQTIWVPYIADFQITLKELPDGKTQVTVQTICAEVIDGHEPGIHVDRANHYRNVP